VGQGKVCQCQPADLLSDTPSATEFNSAGLQQIGGDLRAGGVLLASLLWVSLAYFAVYTVLAVVRSRNQVGQIGTSPFEKVLEVAATSTVYFAPMLCTVFLAVMKRADTLSGGAPGYPSLPPRWLQFASVLCSAGFCAQTVTYIVAEWIAVQGMSVTNSDLQTRAVQTPQQARTVKQWRNYCNFATTVMYLSLAATIFGVLTMEEPTVLKQTEGRTPVRIGTVCTMCLAVVYLFVYFGLHVFRNEAAHSAVEHAGPGTSFGLEVMKLAATAMNFAPMLCILFLGAQVAGDWSGTGLSRAAASWILVSTVSVLLQAALVIAAPLLANAELQVVGARGEIDFVTYNNRVFVLISLVRWVAMVALYVGIAVVCNFLNSTSSETALSRTLLRLAFLYFTAYLALWVAITARQFSEGGFARIIRVLSIAKDTVMFCPMLAALFLESFIRAHQITTATGAAGTPQNYVQDFMVLAVMALTAQLLLVCAAGLSSPQWTTSSGTSEKNHSSSMFHTGFHIAMLVVYLSVLVVVYGIFTINSSNADGAGKWLA
jgi:hypothetical protein